MSIALKEAYERLRQLPFPCFAVDDNLSEWQAELCEFDGHVAGIAITILSGGSPNSSLLAVLPSQVAALRNRFESFRDMPKDNNILAECVLYLDAIENVVRLINDPKSSTNV